MIIRTRLKHFNRCSVLAMPDDLPDLRASHEDRDRRIDTHMVHGRLFIACPPGALIDASGLSLIYSKLKI